MAAGGPGATNQYIDRFDDIRMQRTSNRPIPAGRLTPGEGLAFGVGMARPTSLHPLENTLSSMAFIGLPCPMNSTGICCGLSGNGVGFICLP